MKMQAVKQEVFSLTCTSCTQQLRKERADLTEGRDLRYKLQWLEILEKLKYLRQQGLELSLQDIEKSEEMLQVSLLHAGRMAGLSDVAIEADWQRIKLEAQFTDIHIEEL
jgi:hypothetical protein